MIARSQDGRDRGIGPRLKRARARLVKPVPGGDAKNSGADAQQKIGLIWQSVPHIPSWVQSRVWRFRRNWLVTVIVPVSLIAAGPGRSPPVSNVPLPVGGMQVTAPIEVVNAPIPAGVRPDAVSVIVWADRTPKAPALRCAGQKAPFGATSVAVPLLTTRFTWMLPMNALALGGQSIVVPNEPTPVQGSPCRSPALQVPLWQTGHGDAASPVI